MFKPLSIVLADATRADAIFASRCFPYVHFLDWKLSDLSSVALQINGVLVRRDGALRDSWRGTLVRDSHELALLSALRVPRSRKRPQDNTLDTINQRKLLRRDLIREVERLVSVLYTIEITQSFAALESWALLEANVYPSFLAFDQAFASQVAKAFDLTGFWMLEAMPTVNSDAADNATNNGARSIFAEDISALPDRLFVKSGIATEIVDRFVLSNRQCNTDTYAVSCGLSQTHEVAIFRFADACPRRLAMHYLPDITRQISSLWERTELSLQNRFLVTFTTLERGNFSSPDMLWDQLRATKAYLDVDGLSLILASEAKQGQFKFRKFLIHYDRKEEDDFLSDQGLAVQSIHLMRPLLISSLAGPEKKRLASGFSYDPETLSLSTALPIEVQPVLAPKTKEHESSVAYWPVRLDEGRYALLKAGSFTEPDAFTRKDLRRMKAFAMVILLFVAVSRENAEIRASLSQRRYREEIEDKAMALFHYRDLSLGIFHQLANSLIVAKSKLELLGYLASSKTALKLPDIEVARANVQNALTLISDTQRRGKTLEPLEKECLLLKDVLLPVMEKQKQRFEDAGVDLVRKLGSEDFTVLMDTKWAQESFINLLDNARWAVKERVGAGRSAVTVIVRRTTDGNNVRVSIEDTGIGMDRETLAHVARFDPFVTHRKGGTGLGLYFAQDLFKRFGGQLRIDRSLPNKGTEISVIIPFERAKIRDDK